MPPVEVETRATPGLPVAYAPALGTARQCVRKRAACEVMERCPFSRLGVQATTREEEVWSWYLWHVKTHSLVPFFIS